MKPLSTYTRAGKGTQFSFYYDVRRRQTFFKGEITISHNGKNELPPSVRNTGWRKMLNSYNNNNSSNSTSINNLVCADICSRYWDNAPKTAQTGMFCQNKEDVSVGLILFLFLTYSSNNQRCTKRVVFTLCGTIQICRFLCSRSNYTEMIWLLAYSISC